MRLKTTMVAVALSASVLASAAHAAPFMPDARATTGPHILQVHSTCHANTRRHYDEDFGGPVDHHHRQSNCAVVYDEEEEVEEHCHANNQLHPIPGSSRAVLHRHRASDCRAIIVQETRDCHRDPQQHVVRPYGNIWHRHVGARCAVQELEIYEPGQSTRGCIKLGRITLCP